MENYRIGGGVKPSTTQNPVVLLRFLRKKGLMYTEYGQIVNRTDSRTLEFCARARAPVKEVESASRA